MKTFLIVFGIIVTYIIIGVLYYWTSIKINYKKSKTKKSLDEWLNEIHEEANFRDIRSEYFLWSAMFWIIVIPTYIFAISVYFIISSFSYLVKRILKINQLGGKL